MSEDKKNVLAKEVYDTLCKAIDSNDWSYDKEEDRLIVRLTVNGDDLPIKFIIIVDENRQLISFLSPLTFNMGEDKRVEGAIATCIASYGMADGSFDYDMSDGQIVFRLTASFRESKIGEGLIHHMLACTCAMVDKYNDQFFAINKGFMSIEEFMEKEG